MSYKIVNKIDKKDSLPLEFESEKAAEIYFESNGMDYDFWKIKKVKD